MGMIYISFSGSFKYRPEVPKFTAMNGGHAAAIAQAIEWLAKEALPRAIEQDHEQAANGEKPAIGFGKR